MSHSEHLAPIIVVVHLTAAAGKEAELWEAISAAVEPARAAAGNVGFTVQVSRSNARDFMIFEQWETEQSYLDHENDEAILKFHRLTDEQSLLDGEPQRVHWRELT